MKRNHNGPVEGTGERHRAARRLARVLGVALSVTACGPQMAEDGWGEPVAESAEAATSQSISGSWACPTNTVCEDTYEIDLQAQSEVVIVVNSTTSTIRLGAFAPSRVPSRRNIITGSAADRRCSATPATDQLTFRAQTAGRYRFTFGRDPAGSSADGRGSYNATITSNNPFTFVGKSGEDTTTDVGFQCEWQMLLSGSWNNCTNGCQDMYDVEVRPGTRLTMFATQHFGSVARMAAFEQFTPSSGMNQLTGTNRDRKCTALDRPDQVVFNGVSGGTYHLAFGRDAGGSTGNLNYIAAVKSSDTYFIPIFKGQTADDVRSQAAGTRCGYTYTTTGSWSCAASRDCQNTYDFDLVTSATNAVGLPTSTPVDISLTDVTGNALSRLAVIGSGATNLLNSRASDRRCAAANANDFVTLPATSGRKRFAIGRVGAATPTAGTYKLTLTTPDAVLTPRGQTLTNAAPFFGATSCP